MNNENVVRKNILDLNYNRYLHYSNTCIILLFTFFIGLSFGFISLQIDITNIRQITTVVVVTLSIVGILFILILNFNRHLKKILKKIKNLETGKSEVKQV